MTGGGTAGRIVGTSRAHPWKLLPNPLLENLDWFDGLPDNVDGPLRIMRKLTSRRSDDLAAHLHGALARNFDKGEFALDVFLRLNEKNGGQTLRCPHYIREGLEWLAAELDRVQAMGVS